MSESALVQIFGEGDLFAFRLACASSVRSDMSTEEAAACTTLESAEEFSLSSRRGRRGLGRGESFFLWLACASAVGCPSPQPSPRSFLTGRGSWQCGLSCRLLSISAGRRGVQAPLGAAYSVRGLAPDHMTLLTELEKNQAGRLFYKHAAPNGATVSSP